MPHLVPVIRDLTLGDNMELLTELIHAAYAPHAAKGLRYWGRTKASKTPQHALHPVMALSQNPMAHIWAPLQFVHRSRLRK
jgi:hypothetical protein